MSTEYEKFEKHMKERDTYIPSDKASISIGMKDSRGNLLVLGGSKSNLWRLASGLYAIGDEVTISAEKAVEEYNKLNNTNLPPTYIWDSFEPWYEKQNVIVARVPPNLTLVELIL